MSPLQWKNLIRNLPLAINSIFFFFHLDIYDAFAPTNFLPYFFFLISRDIAPQLQRRSSFMMLEFRVQL